MRPSEDKFLSHHISRKTGLCLASPEPRTGRESYMLRRTARRGRFLSQEENKRNQKEISADA